MSQLTAESFAPRYRKARSVLSRAHWESTDDGSRMKSNRERSAASRVSPTLYGKTTSYATTLRRAKITDAAISISITITTRPHSPTVGTIPPATAGEHTSGSHAA